jgi:hypothetical protein
MARAELNAASIMLRTPLPVWNDLIKERTAGMAKPISSTIVAMTRVISMSVKPVVLRARRRAFVILSAAKDLGRERDSRFGLAAQFHSLAGCFAALSMTVRDSGWLDAFFIACLCC